MLACYHVLLIPTYPIKGWQEVHMLLGLVQLVATHDGFLERGSFDANLAQSFIVAEMIVRVCLVSGQGSDPFDVFVQLSNVVLVEAKLFLQLLYLDLFVQNVDFQLMNLIFFDTVWLSEICLNVFALSTQAASFDREG